MVSYLREVTLPELTAEQRSAAAAAAVAARRERADIKGKVASGELTVSQVIHQIDDNDALGKMRVQDLLEAIPRIGPVRGANIMKDLGIAPSRRLRGLGRLQREALHKHFEGM